MSYKVLTKAVTASGDITNVQANFGNTIGDGPSSLIRLQWSAAILGQLTVSGIAYVHLNYAEGISTSGPPFDDVPIEPYFYDNIQVMAQVPGQSNTGTAPDTPPDPATTTPNTSDPLPNGSYSLSASLTLWADVGVDVPTDNGTNDAAYGVFQGLPAGHVNLYWALTEGSTVTATVAWGGANATATGTVSSALAADATDYVAALFSQSDYAWDEGMEGLLQVPGQAGTTVTMDYSGGTLPGDYAVSNPVGKASTTGGTAETIAIIPAAADAGEGSGIGNGHAATAAMEGSPDKPFSISGICKSVKDEYPGSVLMSCPKFNGDPSPDFTAGPSWGVSGTQQYYSASVSVGIYGYGSDYPGVSDGGGKNNGATLSVGIPSDWLDANGEFVEYSFEDDAGNTINRRFYNSLVFLHCWNFGAVTLSQAASTMIDDCAARNTADGWTGATLVSGEGMQNIGIDPMTLSGASADHDFSGYRYLRISFHDASADGTATLSLGGKTYAQPITASGTPFYVDFDLCDPTNLTDTTDAYPGKWPLDSANRHVLSSPLTGVSVAPSLTLTFSSGLTATTSKIEQIAKTTPQAYFLSEWAPRTPEDQPMRCPEVDSGTGGDAIATTAYAHRGLICTTDAKPSLEYDDIYTAHSESDNMSDWSLQPWSVSEMVDYVNTNSNGGTGTCGWSASTTVPAPDGSQDLIGGGLNQDTGGGACWTCYGWHYAGTADGGWTHSIGACLSAPTQVLVTTISWPPGVGDLFGLGPGGGGPDQTLYLGGSWVTRAQACGLLLSDQGEPAVGQAITLTPAAGEIQDDATPVGWDASASPEGDFCTVGPGLIGYTGGDASEGIVAALGRTATHTFRSRRLSWVGIRGPISPPSCCDALLFRDPALHDPLPALPGDADALPIEEWRRTP